MLKDLVVSPSYLNLLDNFIVKSNFSEPWNYPKVKYLKTHFFKKNKSAHRFEDLFFTKSWKNFFSNKFFFIDLALFSGLHIHSFGRHFWHKN